MSERFLVTGGSRLVGDVHVTGAKNSVLKLMAATLLAEGTSVITNCPAILDVTLMADVLRGLGCEGGDRRRQGIGLPRRPNRSTRPISRRFGTSAPRCVYSAR